MKVNTSRFGCLETPFGEEDIISLPEGLIGFESLRKVFFIDSFEDSMICWLKSVEHKELAFSVLETKFFFPDYTVQFSPRELSILKTDPHSTSKLFIYSILSIPEKIHEMTANLKAPIVINPEKRLASQIVLQENKYLVDYPVFKDIQKLMISYSKSSLKPLSFSDEELKKEKDGTVKLPRKYGIGNTYLGRKPYPEN